MATHVQKMTVTTQRVGEGLATHVWYFFHFFFSLTNVFFFVSKGEGEMIRWIINVQVALFF